MAGSFHIWSKYTVVRYTTSTQSRWGTDNGLKEKKGTSAPLPPKNHHTTSDDFPNISILLHCIKQLPSGNQKANNNPSAISGRKNSSFFFFFKAYFFSLSIYVLMKQLVMTQISWERDSLGGARDELWMTFWPLHLFTSLRPPPQRKTIQPKRKGPTLQKL